MNTNEIKNVHGGMSLGESVDLLRETMDELGENVTELYELDEDNFQKIQGLISGLKEVQKKVDTLGLQVRRNRGKMVLGFAALGGLLWIGNKAIDAMNRRIEALEEKANQAEKEPEKAEESDG